jgi:hypothetical protein
VKNAGYLEDLKLIGKRLYACGGQRQVHRLDASGWKRIDKGAFVPLGDGDHCSFHGIDGFSETDIYAVGWPHDIWHFNGRTWRQLESPTEYPLFAVHCSESGAVYVAGSNGVLFKGDRERGWDDLSDPAVTTEVIEDLVEFRGQIYGAATEHLVATAGGTMKPVDVPLRGAKAYVAIDASKDDLWVVGDESILQFDGKTWKRHICPENV